ncbi:MAG: enoyl-CoA hydratase/isomerase family protein [Acidobacteria bacterium]|nr:enoyl-CoA hydratase/isomerase family protein [Acidobacteriota bacterium]
MLKVLIPEDRRRVTLRFQHPKGNIITAELVRQLRQAADDLRQLPTVRLVVLEGEGNDFSFGASVPEHAPGQIEEVLPDFHALMLDWLHLPMPTAALVRGRCFGGGFELALACDFILAADDATFALPEIALGVFAPAASVLLPARVGLAAATSALLTGATRTSAEWHALGLIERTAPVERLNAAANEWFASGIGRWSAESLRHAVNALRGPVRELAVRELARVEQVYLNDLMPSHDAREGIQAFLDKRAPRWRDS